ncbi:ADP-ribosylation factor-like protein (macronuclear) [Tetrahymena thermophila SB210]|uniref:ADP-ribosylation factor-like protein n=1 Tax=Tetrahymena thermophila (strain SB210) TaxID=312017 RepID=Q234B1_TETTS|nr:ADP-ribosylation factor-like protein [Tetrahymena thermophila SB210]EAR92092.1 ADP-ribosylation factor-like protein [Tetrahymena thermophila SB210]|eukprot:XP_001012337.1 ADP-ribosylation factor-like protein [Tetrahymena thermophila SB210]
MGKNDNANIFIKSISQNHKRLILTGNQQAGQSEIIRQINLHKYSEEYVQNEFNFHKIDFQHLNIIRITLEDQWSVDQYPEGFFNKKDGIIYVLDSDDLYSINQAIYTINQILQVNFDAQIPVLILLTAKDLQLINIYQIKLHLNEFILNRASEIHIQKYSQKTGDGISEAFEWLNYACNKYCS